MVPVVAQLVVAPVEGSVPESSTKTAVMVLAAPFQLAALSKASSSAAATNMPDAAALISAPNAVHAPPSLVEYFHCPSEVSSSYEVIQIPPKESPSVSANPPPNSELTVAPTIAASSASEARVAVPDAVGASLTAATVIVVVGKPEAALRSCGEESLPSSAR